MAISAIIIDDSELAIKTLLSDLAEFCPEVNVLGDANSVISGAKLALKVKPELIFLDIQMGEHDGFDLLDLLGDNNPKIIFVTGSQDYAIKAFQVNAIDYLLKPIDPELLQKAVKKITEERVDKVSTPASNVISFHTAEEVRWAKTTQIIRFQAMGNYTNIFFVDGSKLLVTKTLKEYDDRLSDMHFVRVHQSHLVNLSYIKSFIKSEGGYLLMKNGDQVSVSVRKRQMVMDLLENQI